MSEKPPDFEIGTDNVFADLGLPDPEERLMKAQLSQQIALIVQRGRLTQAQAAERMGISQPKVSAILRGRLGGISVERLITLLLRLGQDVQLVVKPKSGSRQVGTFSVESSMRDRPRAAAVEMGKRKAAPGQGI